jgi:1-acyl-sn-glycerol-3-phosphate acyltransferase
VLAAGAAMQASLDAGVGVVVFPEGTSTDGSGVAPFRTPLFEHAAATGLPVHAAALAFSTPAGSPPAREAVCWWGDMELLPHLAALLRLPSIEARVSFAPEPIVDADRKRLAARLHALVGDEAARLREDDDAEDPPLAAAAAFPQP